MHSTKERVVVSVGGSLIVPDGIDTDFLIRFKALILDKVEKGFSFSIIAGGGKTARRYQEAAHIVTPLSQADLDWIGIHATRLNAQLLRNIFVGHAHPHIIKIRLSTSTQTSQSSSLPGGNRAAQLTTTQCLSPRIKARCGS